MPSTSAPTPGGARPRRRAAVVLLVLGALAFAGAATTLALQARRSAAALEEHLGGAELEARRHRWRALVTERAPRLAEQRRAMTGLAGLATPAPRHDAGPLLNALVDWPVPWPARPRAPLALPPDTARALARWESGDVRVLAAIDLAAVDLGWMTELRRYDHWDIEHHSPWDDLTPEQLATGWFADREPRLEALVPWAQLRLMKGLRDGAMADALNETRQLARLMLSTETLIGAVQAMRVLRLERQAWAAALFGRADELAAWQPLGDAALFDASIAELRATPALLSALAPEGEADRALAGPLPGRCSVLREAAMVALWLRPLMEDAHREHYRRLAARLADPALGCRLPLLRRAFEPPSLLRRWRSYGQLGEDGLPHGGATTTPLPLRLALLVSPGLRARTGETVLLGLATAALAGAGAGADTRDE